MEKKEIKFFLLLAVVSAAMLFLNQFSGDYSTNDDWLYSVAVRDLLDNGSYSLDFVSTVAMAQIYGGAAMALIFGLNHVVLRVFVMLLSIIGIIAAYFLFRENDFAETESALAALALLSNPLYYSLSLSFMSDVPFTALYLCSMLFYFKWEKTDSTKHLCIASLLAILAFLSRPFGIFLPISAVLYSVAARKSGKQRNIAIGFLIAGLAIAAITAIIEQNINTSFGFGISYKNIARIFGIPMYLGFFLAPLALLLLLLEKKARKAFIENKKRLAIATAFVLAGISIGLFLLHRVMPYFGNMLNASGLGFPALTGGKTEIFPEFSWIAATIASAISLVFLAQIARFREFAKKQNLLVSINIALLFVAMVSFNYFYDRFMLPLVPLSSLLLFMQLKGYKHFKKALAVLIIVFAAFSFTQTFEYHSWNTERYAAINSLVAAGVDPLQVDGGHEYCSEHFNEKAIGKKIENPCESGTAEYVIAFRKMPGYEIIEERPYYGLFGNTAGKIVVLKKEVSE